MPLRDHFHPPLSERASWEEVHGGWPMVIVQHLGRTLPDRYVAAPRVHLGAQWEVDIATLDRDVGGPIDRRPEDAGGVATAWAPAAPTLAVETELADQDEYEVRVYDARHGRRLVAAVELVSPSNKDRPEARAQFVAKCAALLRRQVSVVVVDVVTARAANLYAELLELIGERDPALGADPPPTYATACRWHPRGVSRWLEVWGGGLVVGRPLPVLPLWLTDEFAVPLDLEASYEQTCRDLRIR
ncbi:MAG: hypothetical protein JWO31_1941 [Phycisphaerales bacterium]|nr:hypothetical protein [Phycisphaerales bacterium]